MSEDRKPAEQIDDEKLDDVVGGAGFVSVEQAASDDPSARLWARGFNPQPEPPAIQGLSAKTQKV